MYACTHTTNVHNHTHTLSHIFPQTKYREDMQSIYLSLPSAELVSPPLTEQLTVLERAVSVPVEWAELTELALRPLFQNISVEVEDLWMILEDMVCVCACACACVHVHVVVCV